MGLARVGPRLLVSLVSEVGLGLNCQRNHSQPFRFHGRTELRLTLFESGVNARVTRSELRFDAAFRCLQADFDHPKIVGFEPQHDTVAGSDGKDRLDMVGNLGHDAVANVRRKARQFGGLRSNTR